MQLHIHALLSVYPSSFPLLIHLSTHLSILLSFISCLSIMYYLPSIYLFLHPSIHPSCLPALPPFIYLSMSMYPSSSSHICTFMGPLLPTHPSSPTHLFIHFSLVTHPSLFIHPYSFTHSFSLFIVSNCPSVHTAFHKIHSQYIHVKKNVCSTEWYAVVKTHWCIWYQALGIWITVPRDTLQLFIWKVASFCFSFLFCKTFKIKKESVMQCWVIQRLEFGHVYFHQC